MDSIASRSQTQKKKKKQCRTEEGRVRLGNDGKLEGVREKGTVVLKSSANRPNLFYEVRPKPKSDEDLVREIVQFIKSKYPNKTPSGIIYCFSKKEADQVAQGIQAHGIRAAPYHADIPSAQKTRTQREWTNDRIQVVVATIAFGLGVNKADVRFVIHFTLSKSLDSFYQETGRAGRDGRLAHCLLFYRPLDAFNRQSCLVFNEHCGLKNVYLMVQYCQNQETCRRELILRHFGENSETSSSSLRVAQEASTMMTIAAEEHSDCCDNCLRRKRASSELEVFDLVRSKAADQMLTLLEMAQRYQQRLTLIKLAELWKGSGRKQFASLDANFPKAPSHFKRLDCEYAVGSLIVSEILREDFQHTSYSTTSYIIPGRYASVARSASPPLSSSKYQLHILRTAKTTIVSSLSSSSSSSSGGGSTGVAAEGTKKQTKRSQKLEAKLLEMRRDIAASQPLQTVEAILSKTEIEKIIDKLPRTLTFLSSIIPSPTRLSLIGQLIIQLVDECHPLSKAKKLSLSSSSTSLSVAPPPPSSSSISKGQKRMTMALPENNQSSLDDLFGDIDDFVERPPPAKRQRTRIVDDDEEDIDDEDQVDDDTSTTGGGRGGKGEKTRADEGLRNSGAAPTTPSSIVRGLSSYFGKPSCVDSIVIDDEDEE